MIRKGVPVAQIVLSLIFLTFYIIMQLISVNRLWEILLVVLFVIVQSIMAVSNRINAKRMLNDHHECFSYNLMILNNSKLLFKSFLNTMDYTIRLLEEHSEGIKATGEMDYQEAVERLGVLKKSYEEIKSYSLDNISESGGFTFFQKNMEEINMFLEKTDIFLELTKRLLPVIDKNRSVVKSLDDQRESFRHMVIEYRLYTELLSGMLGAIIDNNRDVVSDLSEKVFSIKTNISSFINTIKNWEEKYFLNTSTLNYAKVINNYQDQNLEFKKISNLIESSAMEQEENLRAFVSRMENILDSSRGIEEISEKVKILSINASIEAAQAGAHGKGFEVVASEINKLAEDSRSIVDNIIRIVTESRSFIRDVTGDSVREREVIHEGLVNQHQQLNGAFENLRTYFTEFNNMFKSVAELVNKISQHINQFNILFQYHDIESQELGNIRNVLNNFITDHKEKMDIVEKHTSDSVKLSITEDILKEFEKHITTDLEYSVLQEAFRKYSIKVPERLKRDSKEIDLW